MKQITLSILTMLLSGILTILTAQQQALPEKEQPEVKKEKTELETSEEPPKEIDPKTQQKEIKDPQKAKENNPSEDIKKVSPNRQEGAAKRSSARPAHGARPEIIRPERGRPAGAGRPQGAGRPGRN